MKRLISLSLTFFTCICLLLASERRALAYIDPGTGLLALQSFFAGLAATGYFLRRKIVALFGRDKKPTGIPVPVTLRQPIAIKKEASRNAA